jgi:glycyl-tRNA synthetase beta chain
LREKGFSHGLTTLALSVAGSRPLQALRFLDVFSAVQGEPWFTGLVVSAVRVRNILQKADNGHEKVDPGLFSEAAEKALFESVETLSPEVAVAVEGFEWEGLAKILARLEPFVTAFFEKVLVMDEDDAVRNNRLSLLERCNRLFKSAGDLGILKS